MIILTGNYGTLRLWSYHRVEVSDLLQTLLFRFGGGWIGIKFLNWNLNQAQVPHVWSICIELEPTYIFVEPNLNSYYVALLDLYMQLSWL